MSKILSLTFVGIAISLLTLTSCEKESDCPNAVKATFTDLTGLDGCGMVIELENGDRIEPVNLSDFEIDVEDGKKIWVEYHSFSGASICMVGEIVEIDCIGER